MRLIIKDGIKKRRLHFNHKLLTSFPTQQGLCQGQRNISTTVMLISATSTNCMNVSGVDMFNEIKKVIDFLVDSFFQLPHGMWQLGYLVKS